MQAAKRVGRVALDVVLFPFRVVGSLVFLWIFWKTLRDILNRKNPYGQLVREIFPDKRPEMVVQEFVTGVILPAAKGEGER